MDSLGLALNPRDKLLLFVAVEVTELHQVEQATNRREWIANLMRDAGGESSDSRQPSAPNELLLGRRELGSGTLQLFESLLKRCSVFSKLRGHFVEGRSQARDLGGALHGHASAQPPGGEALGGQSQSVDRPHDEIRQQDIGQQQHRGRGQAEVEQKQASPRRVAAIARGHPDSQLQAVRSRHDRIGIAFEVPPAFR